MAGRVNCAKRPLAQITWYHNLTLLEKLKNQDTRLWYAPPQNHSIRVESQHPRPFKIETDLHDRQGKGANELRQGRCRAPQSELAQQVIKEPIQL